MLSYLNQITNVQLTKGDKETMRKVLKDKKNYTKLLKNGR